MENTIFDSLPGDMLAWPQEWDELSPSCRDGCRSETR